MGTAPAPRGILLVDDDADLAEALAVFLRSQGWTVSLWGRSDGVAAETARLRPALILLDLMLAPAGGRRALLELKADPRIRDIPVLVITGLADEKALAEALEAGAAGVLRKPFDMPLLLRTIRERLTVSEARP